MGTAKDSMTMESSMTKRTSGLGVGLVVVVFVLVRVLVRSLWEVCLDGMRPREFRKNLKGQVSQMNLNLKMRDGVKLENKLWSRYDEEEEDPRFPYELPHPHPLSSPGLCMSTQTETT